MKKETIEEYALRQERELMDLLVAAADRLDNIKSVRQDMFLNALKMAKDYLIERFNKNN